jgi:hypothetical protein
MENEKSNKQLQKTKPKSNIDKQKEKELRIIELENMKNNKVKLYQMLHSTFK